MTALLLASRNSRKTARGGWGAHLLDREYSDDRSIRMIESEDRPVGTLISPLCRTQDITSG
jgi:hypothetical protein